MELFPLIKILESQKWSKYNSFKIRNGQKNDTFKFYIYSQTNYLKLIKIYIGGIIHALSKMQRKFS
jgi:hypothetical protein